MAAKEMMKKEHFYVMGESHYVCGITYIRTLGKEYQEISFYEESGIIYTVIENLTILDDNIISAINEQVLEFRLAINDN